MSFVGNHWITLAGQDIEQCKRLSSRFAKQQKQGRWKNKPNNPQFIKHEEASFHGYCAEYAFHRYADVEWYTPLIEQDKVWATRGDCEFGIEIKSAHAPNRHLLVNRDDHILKTNRPVVFALTDILPTVEFVGWITAVNITLYPGEQITPNARYCYLVPQEKLKPIDELLHLIKAWKREKQIRLESERKSD